jgi:hypothetical protein
MARFADIGLFLDTSALAALRVASLNTLWQNEGLIGVLAMKPKECLALIASSFNLMSKAWRRLPAAVAVSSSRDQGPFPEYCTLWPLAVSLGSAAAFANSCLFAP